MKKIKPSTAKKFGQASSVMSEIIKFHAQIRAKVRTHGTIFALHGRLNKKRGEDLKNEAAAKGIAIGVMHFEDCYDDDAAYEFMRDNPIHVFWGAPSESLASLERIAQAYKEARVPWLIDRCFLEAHLSVHPMPCCNKQQEAAYLSFVDELPPYGALVLDPADVQRLGGVGAVVRKFSPLANVVTDSRHYKQEGLRRTVFAMCPFGMEHLRRSVEMRVQFPDVKVLVNFTD